MFKAYSILAIVLLLCTVDSAVKKNIDNYRQSLTKHGSIIATSSLLLLLPMQHALAINEQFNSEIPSSIINPKTVLTPRTIVIRETEKFLSSNKVLEALRKVDQLEDDDRFMSNADLKSRALLLYPMIEMNDDINTIEKQLNSIKDIASTSYNANTPIKEAMDILKSISTIINKDQFNTAIMKKLFNRYSDNIFYTNPKEANLYLAGGATPNSDQTQLYLFRNSAITAVNFAREDVNDLIKQTNKGGSSSGNYIQMIDDAIDDLDEAKSSLTEYFNLCDKDDYDVAVKQYATRH